MSTRYIKILRAFYIDRKPTVVGDVIPVGAAFAKELVLANKASFAEAPAEKAIDQKAKAPHESKAALPQKGEKHVPG